MRLTQTTLIEYLEADQLIKRLEARKAEIRKAILGKGQPEFKLGEYTVRVTQFERLCPLPINELKQVVDKVDPKLFGKLTRIQESDRVTVKKTGGALKALAVAFIALAVAATGVGCSSVPRNKWTDKTLRVMIDPESVTAKHYVRVQQALMASGKWIVVDRGMGYNAIKKEQEREHREQSDRFLDSEKYAHWGKLYGVGGIVVAHAQCVVKDGIFKKNFPVCKQYLAIVDSNSGEVIASAEDESEGGNYDYELAPSWEDIVAKLNNAYPEKYEPNKDHKVLRDYKELSQEEATRQKEQLARDLAGKKE